MRHRASSKRYWRLKLKNARNARRVRHILGRQLERYVSGVLRSAMEAGAPIKGVKEVLPFSPADHRGHDVVIIDSEGVWHPLQVKSSDFEAQKFRRHGNERGLPYIAVIVPRLNDTPQQILDKVGEEIPFLRGFKLERGGNAR